jgi:hypothetical protein
MGGSRDAARLLAACSRTTPHNHTQILRKAPDTVVAAIEDVVRQAS